MTENTFEDKIYLTPKEVAAYLSVSRTTVSKLVEKGILPKPHVLTERVRRFKRSDIDAALSGEWSDRTVVDVRRAQILKGLKG